MGKHAGNLKFLTKRGGARDFETVLNLYQCVPFSQRRLSHMEDLLEVIEDEVIRKQVIFRWKDRGNRDDSETLRFLDPVVNIVLETRSISLYREIGKVQHDLHSSDPLKLHGWLVARFGPKVSRRLLLSTGAPLMFLDILPSIDEDELLWALQFARTGRSVRTLCLAMERLTASRGFEPPRECARVWSQNGSVEHLEVLAMLPCGIKPYVHDSLEAASEYGRDQVVRWIFHQQQRHHTSLPGLGQTASLVQKCQISATRNGHPNVLDAWATALEGLPGQRPSGSYFMEEILHAGVAGGYLNTLAWWWSEKNTLVPIERDCQLTLRDWQKLAVEASGAGARGVVEWTVGQLYKMDAPKGTPLSEELAARCFGAAAVKGHTDVCDYWLEMAESMGWPGRYKDVQSCDEAWEVQGLVAGQGDMSKVEWVENHQLSSSGSGSGSDDNDTREEKENRPTKAQARRLQESAVRSGSIEVLTRLVELVDLGSLGRDSELVVNLVRLASELGRVGVLDFLKEWKLARGRAATPFPTPESLRFDRAAVVGSARHGQYETFQWWLCNFKSEINQALLVECARDARRSERHFAERWLKSDELRVKLDPSGDVLNEALWSAIDEDRLRDAQGRFRSLMNSSTLVTLGVCAVVGAAVCAVVLGPRLRRIK